MKKILYLIVLLSLTSCGYNEVKCLEEVTKTFPNGEVTQIPGERWKFLVLLPDGSVWYAETNSKYTTKVTMKVRLW